MTINNDLHLLKMAAFELLCEDNKNDLVRVAGIIQRVKNWVKARFSKEFRERQEDLKESYDEVKSPLTDLIRQLGELDKAFKGQDSEAVARLVGQIPGAISQVTGDLRKLKTQMNAADAAIPEVFIDESGRELSRDNLRWLTQGYKQNKQLVQQLLDLLPEQFRNEIQVGKRINVPMSSLSWYGNYSPSDISISQNVYNQTKDILIGNLKRRGLSDNFINNIIQRGYDDFINSLKSSILQDGILLQANLSNISRQITHRRANEIELEIMADNVPMLLGDEELFIDVGRILAHDLGTSVNPRKQISVFLIRFIDFSPDSANYLMKQEALNNELESELSRAEGGLITSLVKKGIMKRGLLTTYCGDNHDQ